MGSEAPILYRSSSPICESSMMSNLVIGWTSASSFLAKAAVNSSTAASASFMMADAASVSMPDGKTYPDDTSGRSMSYCVEATARARWTPRRKVLLACSAIRPPSACRRLATELPDKAPSPSSSWHTLTAVCSSSAYSSYAAISTVLTASFCAVSSATAFFSSEQGNKK